MSTERRVAVINDIGWYVEPALDKQMRGPSGGSHTDNGEHDLRRRRITRTRHDEGRNDE